MEIKLTKNIMSCISVVKYMILPTSFLYNIGSTLDPSFSLPSFVPVAINVTIGLQIIILKLFNTSFADLD